ncbi:hypothetical protein [Ruegeria profundi]|uniref:hypothetical protein n=1 Tax=Ruegeria profundi TaxID=1685378 RepID=UPI001CD459DD|nr:hypothetical protein [Ruegeria profundi]MCA0927100.1 hypothetical protein [Ruegeria profundi]
MNDHRYKRALRDLAERFGCDLMASTRGYRFERGLRTVAASRKPRKRRQHLETLEQVPRLGETRELARAVDEALGELSAEINAVLRGEK